MMDLIIGLVIASVLFGLIFPDREKVRKKSKKIKKMFKK